MDGLFYIRRHGESRRVLGPIRRVDLRQPLIAGAVILTLGVAYFEATKDIGHFGAEPAPSVEPVVTATSPATLAPSSASAGLSSQPASTASRSPSAVPAAVTAQYVYSKIWDNRFTMRITVTNVATTSQRWAVTVTVPTGVDLTSSWSSQAQQTGQTLEFTPEKNKATLAPGESWTFGFQADHTGTYQLQSCLINGRPCS